MNAIKRYETGKAPHVLITRCSGDLLVRGSREASVQVKGEHSAEQSDKGLLIAGDGSLSIYLPEQTMLVLQDISGDSVIKGVRGGVTAETVAGDLVCKALASTTVGTVHGDLAVSNVDESLLVDVVHGDMVVRHAGPLTVKMAHGDLVARFIAGDVTIDQAMGDANLETANGDVHVAAVGRDINLNNLGGKVEVKGVAGDIRLRGSLAPGKHLLEAGGDIVVRWPESEPLDVLVQASEVYNRLPLTDISEEGDTFSGRLGDGETTLVLNAQGRVILKAVDMIDWKSDVAGEWDAIGADFATVGAELAGLGQQISEEIGNHMAEFTTRIEEHLGADFAQRMAERAAKKTERAMKRAIRQSEQVRRKSAAWTPTASPQPAKEETAPSAEEQMKILSMLEKGIISVEEADTLLKALESE